MATNTIGVKQRHSWPWMCHNYFMKFYEKLERVWKSRNSMLCVGLDPDLEALPVSVRSEKWPIFEFNRAIIDSTHDLVCCYKPQIAFYSAVAAEKELEMTIQYLREKHPATAIILDAKRGDIGSTAEMYAKEAFDRYGADAVTVNPFMGSDTLEPFLRREEKGVVVLCKTSNPGSGEFQNNSDSGQETYKMIAHQAQHHWNKEKNVLLLVGATYPREMAEIRKIAFDIPFLVPGIGTQRGDIREIVHAGMWEDGFGMIISSSRHIIYAGSGDDFAQAARSRAAALRNEINRCKEVLS
jgi:orotidine-5'-phosphate decarboxylase